MRYKLPPPPPFDFENVAIFAGDTNPGIRVPDTDDEYECHNCDDVVAVGVRVGQFSDGTLLQCAVCKAYNALPDAPGRAARILTSPPHPLLYRFSTGLRVPLDPSSSALLGEFACIWGHLDEILLICIALLRKVDLPSASALLAKNPSGPRHSLFKEALKDCRTPHIVTRGNDLSKRLSKLLGKRNAIMHGVLGRWQNDKGQFEAAWLHAGDRVVVPLSDLLGITEQASDAAYDALSILFALTGRPSPPRGHPDSMPILEFGPGIPTLPSTWLRLVCQPSGTPDPQS